MLCHVHDICPCHAQLSVALLLLQDDTLLSYQIGFDLFENEMQSFLHTVRLLPSPLIHLDTAEALSKVPIPCEPPPLSITSSTCQTHPWRWALPHTASASNLHAETSHNHLSCFHQLVSS